MAQRPPDPPSSSSPAPSLVDLARHPDVAPILADHAARGNRMQVVVRAALVVFMALTVTFVPPLDDEVACWVVIALYAVWTLLLAALTWRPRVMLLRFAWLTLLIDLAVLTLLVVLAGHSEAQTWTADVLVNGFFLVPLLAATQLRPWVGVAVGLPTVVAYLLAEVAAEASNQEPWWAVFLDTLVLAGLVVAAILLSRIQRSRVITIGRLALQRTALVTELVAVEDRERRALAEHLHDGALQYVLAALQDLDDVRDRADPDALDRVEEALRESSQLLRSTVSQLHSAVLEQVGLPKALRDLAQDAGRRGRFAIEVDGRGWDDRLRTSADILLLTTARELLTNVAKHAGATQVRVVLSWHQGLARLTVADDGRGIDEANLARRLGEGHIGVASRRVRVEAAGGRLTLRRGEPRGTVAEVAVPAASLAGA